MSIPGDGLSPAERTVRESIAVADRRRRVRRGRKRLWRIAPWLAAVTLLVTAAARWQGWSPIVPQATSIVGALALAVVVLAGRRERRLSDADAAAIDADAALGGELRSAHWFIAPRFSDRGSLGHGLMDGEQRRPSLVRRLVQRVVRSGDHDPHTEPPRRRDAWAEFHVEAAAERLRQVRWNDVYPVAPVARARIVTALMAVGALALALTMPDRILGPARAAAAAGLPGSPPGGTPLALSPELQRQLEALLAATEAGADAKTQALAADPVLQAELQALLQRQDPALLEALARALGAADATTRSAREQAQALADRARRATESAAMSDSMKRALEQLADELEVVQPEPTITMPEESAAGPSGSQDGQKGQAQAGGAPQDLSIQFDAQSAPAGGAGMVMMSSQDGGQSSGPPGSGIGGGSGSADATSAAAAIDAALTQELVEANADDAGANVETEIRRKTEQGQAKVAFTRGASGAFDRGRAAAPPAVPEGRRTGVQTYFIRTPR